MMYVSLPHIGDFVLPDQGLPHADDLRMGSALASGCRGGPLAEV